VSLLWLNQDKTLDQFPAPTAPRFDGDLVNSSAFCATAFFALRSVKRGEAPRRTCPP
jgi:hypothetical protein